MFHVDPNTLTIIGLDTKDGPEHLLWDERTKLPIDEAMVVNIMAVGVRVPISVSVHGSGESKSALVVDGRQRVRHAREANKRLAQLGEPLIRVPVVAEKGMNERLQDILAISLNAIRQDDPVMVKSAKASRMKDRGHSADEIALAFGVTAQTVMLWLAINGLTGVVKKAISDGKIRPTAAGKLSTLTPEEQKTALAELLAESDATGQKLTVEAADAKSKSKRKADSAEDATVAPKRRVLRRVIETGGEVLSEEFIAGVRYAIGDLSPKSIKGLTALLALKKK
jgi:ParB family chromosome partitioning protein